MDWRDPAAEVDELLHEGSGQVRGFRRAPLRLNVEVHPEGGLSQQKIDETKAAIRELGLDDRVNVK